MHLVTGAAGFIGSNIVHALNQRGIDDILAVDDLSDGQRYRNLVDLRIADYMDRAEFRRALVQRKLDGAIETICHQGACSDTMEYDGRYMLDNNFTASKELLRFALDRKIPMVYASSAAVYGDSNSFVEDPGFERPLNVYGYSKLLFDQCVRRLQGHIDTTIVGLRYFNVYGPREQAKGKMASIAYQLFRQITETGVARLFEGSGGYGDGEQRRDFVFVGDLVEINLHCLFSERPHFGIFNAGTGKSRSFNDIANALIQHLGRGRIEYIPMPETLRDKYQNFTEAEIKALRNAGFTRDMTELEEGLRQSLEAWQQEQTPA